LRPEAARRLLNALIAVVIAVGLLIVTSGDEGATSPGPRRGDEATALGTSHLQREEVSAALRRGVRRAAALGGDVEAALAFEPSLAPEVVADPGSSSERWMRMWSMSKVVTLVTLLRAMGWGEKRGEPLSPELRDALQGAIRRSENCRQRRVVIELQEQLGSTEAVRAAMEKVLRMAGAKGRISEEVEAPDPSCLEYLEGQDEIEDPLADGLLLGTSTWRADDAARFVEALGAGLYGQALGEQVLDLMRAPKEVSREVAPGELTAPLDWGAGHALADLAPAYKAGWGGTQQGAFLVGQIVSLELPGFGPLGLAVMFHPDLQPPLDDPGRTAGPEALELVMESVGSALKGTEASGFSRIPGGW
jgi:hypothetical protein